MTQMSSAPSTTTAPQNLIAWVIGSIALLLLLTLLMFLVWLASTVTGNEFAPSHFQSQEFEFKQIPLTNWQINPVVRSSSTDSTSQYLVAQKLIHVPPTPANQWDLVRINRLFGSHYDADPSMLTTYLNGHGGSGIDWEQWSKDHPAAAAVLWPVVQQMAIDGLYLMLPRLFELAENETDPVKLQRDLDDYLNRVLPGFAVDLFNAGHQSKALIALESAVASYPENETFQKTLTHLLSLP